ncbi:MAG TPA: hypothetical protein PLV85_25190, partial [Polyangiaceae bacterium]|nr:hypothetical protein [Polyangiaceae bacterium]
MSRYSIVCVLLCLAAISTLWLPSPSSSLPSPASQERTNVRIGLVFDVGGRGDKSFNDSAFAGLERAERELGV